MPEVLWDESRTAEEWLRRYFEALHACLHLYHRYLDVSTRRCGFCDFPEEEAIRWEQAIGTELALVLRQHVWKDMGQLALLNGGGEMVFEHPDRGGRDGDWGYTQRDFDFFLSPTRGNGSCGVDTYSALMQIDLPADQVRWREVMDGCVGFV